MTQEMMDALHEKDERGELPKTVTVDVRFYLALLGNLCRFRIMLHEAEGCLRRRYLDGALAQMNMVSEGCEEVADGVFRLLMEGDTFMDWDAMEADAKRIVREELEK